MRLGLIGLALAAGVAAFATQASAAPIAPLGQDDGIVLVAGGCGPGFHRTPWGGCRPNWAGPPRGPHCWWTRGPWGQPHRVCRW